MVKKLPYGLGTRFWIPLRNGGFARGLVVRMNGEGVIFAYFFAPKSSSTEDWDGVGSIELAKAVLCGRVGDLGLLNGEWKIESELANWKAEDWPIPQLSRRDSEGQILICTYNDRLQFQSERVGSAAELERLPRDVLMGYGSAEIKLTKLLAD